MKLSLYREMVRSFFCNRLSSIGHDVKVTLAGIGAVSVEAVLIVFTWRQISGTLVHIWNTWQRARHRDEDRDGFRLI